MNFLGVGPAELLVILVVALVFVGPDRLPRMAADIARTIREVRRYTGRLAAEFNEVVQDIERETEGERTQWKDIGEGLSSATQSVTETIRSVRQDMHQPPDNAAATTPPGLGSDAQPPSDWVDVPEPEGDRPNGAAPSPNGVQSPAHAEEPR